MLSIGLPKSLSVILNQLVINNNLNSWNVYENRKGQLCCNISFDISEVATSSSTECASKQPSDFTCSYRRVSKHQQSRNLARVASHRKKRKLEEILCDPNKGHASPEQNRTESHESAPICLDTPSPVHNFTMTTPELECIDTPQSLVENYDDSFETPVQLPLTPLQPHVEPVEYLQAVATSKPVHDIYPEPVVAVTSPPPIPTTHIENDFGLSTDTVSESEEYHDHDSEEYHDCPNTPVSEEVCQPESNHQIKCPCCNEKMTPSHTCSSNFTDNLSKMPSISTKSVGTPFPSPPLTSKITLVPDPKPPDQPPLGLRWVSRRMPIPADKCQHLQPCMFC
jgi:hypothetical protein